MVLEYLEGHTLREWMAQRDHPPTAEPPAETDSSRLVSPSLAVELMIPVVRALACVHKLGIVHRDLKLENIFLTAAGKIVVLDFGIAKRLDASELSAFKSSVSSHCQSTRLTQDGVLLGTLPYMSPEQLLFKDIDARSDLWTVGIILYELITGAHPLPHRSASALRAIAASDEPMPKVRDARPDVGALGAIIDRCLHKQRDGRYGAAEELLAALEVVRARWRDPHAQAPGELLASLDFRPGRRPAPCCLRRSAIARRVPSRAVAALRLREPRIATGGRPVRSFVGGNG